MLVGKRGLSPSRTASWPSSGLQPHAWWMDTLKLGSHFSRKDYKLFLERGASLLRQLPGDGSKSLNMAREGHIQPITIGDGSTQLRELSEPGTSVLGFDRTWYGYSAVTCRVQDLSNPVRERNDYRISGFCRTAASYRSPGGAVEIPFLGLAILQPRRKGYQTLLSFWKLRHASIPEIRLRVGGW